MKSANYEIGDFAAIPATYVEKTAPRTPVVIRDPPQRLDSMDALAEQIRLAREMLADDSDGICDGVESSEQPIHDGTGPIGSPLSPRPQIHEFPSIQEVRSFKEYLSGFDENAENFENTTAISVLVGEQNEITISVPTSISSRTSLYESPSVSSGASLSEIEADNASSLVSDGPVFRSPKTQSGNLPSASPSEGRKYFSRWNTDESSSAPIEDPVAHGIPRQAERFYVGPKPRMPSLVFTEDEASRMRSCSLRDDDIPKTVDYPGSPFDTGGGGSFYFDRSAYDYHTAGGGGCSSQRRNISVVVLIVMLNVGALTFLFYWSSPPHAVVSRGPAGLVGIDYL
eukprot:CAMPEP_0194300106 /NCGR_PEP_ID=MMETSP0169-20130528/61075_1 /TAXON_ID=218684 /ORGANISM="Corethron pennatum, Strain L29A3" /LENGTH=340 /DNA_ID=CAMNT_0039050245 /DNA_START=68 /DNA_END=1090 /DNA_ORIENTATION=+